MNELQKFFIRRLSLKAKPYIKSFGLLQTVKFFNNAVAVWEPEGCKVLVLAPHFDDEVIGCGGTLYKHLQKGAEVTVAFLTDGRNGSKSTSNLPLKELKKAEEKIVAIRKNEARLALN
ncbi:MAG: PIG-L family deacetylase, partial [Ignavibacteriaceae bacterium]